MARSTSFANRDRDHEKVSGSRAIILGLVSGSEPRSAKLGHTYRASTKCNSPNACLLMKLMLLVERSSLIVNIDIRSGMSESWRLRQSVVSPKVCGFLRQEQPKGEENKSG